MIYRIIILLLFIFYRDYASGQHLIKGTITDRNTHKPIPFANIVKLGTESGSSSNIDGEFILKTKAFPLKIVITHIGYVNHTITIKNASAKINIELIPSAVSLPEFEIVHENYGTFFVKEAVEKLIKAKGNLFYGKAFYRQTTFNDSEAVEMQEIFFNVMLNPIKMLETKTVQGRYASQKDRLFRYGMKFINFTDFTKNLSVLPHNDSGDFFTFSEVDSLLTTEFIQVIKDNGHRIAEIKLSSGLAKGKRKNEELTLYIDMDNFLINRIYRISYLDYTTINSSVQKAINQQTIFDYTFRQVNDSLALLEYFDATHSFYLISKRDKPYKIKVQSHTYFYELGTSPINTNPGSPQKSENDRNSIDSLVYDPIFWDNNPVIKRTLSEETAIKTFNKKNYFGRIVDNQ